MCLRFVAVSSRHNPVFTDQGATAEVVPSIQRHLMGLCVGLALIPSDDLVVLRGNWKHTGSQTVSGQVKVFIIQWLGLGEIYAYKQLRWAERRPETSWLLCDPVDERTSPGAPVYMERQLSCFRAEHTSQSCFSPIRILEKWLWVFWEKQTFFCWWVVMCQALMTDMV